MEQQSINQPTTTLEYRANQDCDCDCDWDWDKIVYKTFQKMDFFQKEGGVDPQVQHFKMWFLNSLKNMQKMNQDGLEKIFYIF